MYEKKNLIKRLASLSMCLIIFVCLSTAAVAWFGSKNDVSLPTVAAFAKDGENGNIVTFTESDFTGKLTAGAELDGIVVDALPDAQAGVLTLSGRNIVRGEGVAVESLSSLRFIPYTEEELSATFSFVPVFADSKVGAESIPVTINLTTGRNQPPIAENLVFETYKNVPISGKFKATDPDGTELTYQIIDRPKMGEVTVEANGFRYIPVNGKHGQDMFSYVAVDAAGSSSETATVGIIVNKRKDKGAMVYADMDQHTSHYAAIRLSEMGIMTGEKIGECFFLNPDASVTRSEFIAMAVTAADIATPTAALNTGLSDDESIATWAKPYVSAALHAGVIRGSLTPEGKREMRPNDPITRAEAAVILNNIADISSDGREVFFADMEAIPTWALQAAVNMESTRIMEPDAEGAMNPSQIVTRGETAQMFYDTVSLITSREKSGGLLAWAMGRS